MLGNVDLTPYDFDGPLPDNLPMSNASQSTSNTSPNWRRKTIYDAPDRPGGGRRARNMVVKGTPKQIADHMEHWYVEEAADGFNIMPPYLPGAFNDFVDW